MPANQNSGGLAELPELSVSELRALYPDMGDEEFTKFRRILHKNRKRGFAINHGIFEHDVSAVGACLFNELGDPLGAISISIPTERFLSVQRKCSESLLTYTRDLNRKFEVLKVRI